MRRILSALLLLPALALAATTTPVQLLSPTGSTAGQAIVSNGPGSAPTWQAVPLTGVTGVLPIANGGTNASTASAALSNLGGAALTGATFTGDVTISNAGAGDRFLSVSGLAGNSRGMFLQTSGSRRWAIYANATAEAGSDAGSDLAIRSYTDAGSPKTFVVTISRATGVATFSARPVFGSATPWDSANLASPASTTGNLGQFASTTSAQLATVISNETGSGALVFGTSPTLTTPNIVGTATNDSAAAGSVGEYVTNAATGVSLTSATTASITSVSLTAGDWDVSGVATFAPAGTTTTSQIISGISTVNNTLPANNSGGYNLLGLSFPAGAAQSFGTPVVRISVASTTTVYLVGQAIFSVSTMTANGFIRARRVR